MSTLCFTIWLLTFGQKMVDGTTVGAEAVVVAEAGAIRVRPCSSPLHSYAHMKKMHDPVDPTLQFWNIPSLGNNE